MHTADADGVCVRRILTTILGLLVIGAGTVLIPNATSALAANQTNAQGVALAARVNDAYKHVPGAILTIRVGASSEVFTQALRNGVVVAEQFEGASSAGTTNRSRACGIWKSLPAERASGPYAASG